MTFSDLGLSAEVLRAVEDAGYTEPTPIQQSAIPVVLMGRDVLGCAQTGTGKTAGFTLPMIDILSTGRARARMPRSLILTPTRELATQIAENFDIYGKYTGLTKALLIGGVSMDDQKAALDRGVDVLIATPGRLIDLFEQGRILLADIKVLVIDEADRMLDMGFIPDVERIVGLLPTIRQTLFFSATMPPEVRRIGERFLMNPKEISVDPPASAAETVVQHLTIVDDREKRETLRRIIAAEDVKNALVFCNRKRDVDILYKSLQKHGFNVAALHGDMAQSSRTETLERFKADEITFLVCSDVAARGIDISDLSHVFNFDVPMNAEDYVHRIGRTGRAGKGGRAFTLATPDDGKFVRAIVDMIGREIPAHEVDGVESEKLDESDDRGGRRGRGRGSRSGGRTRGGRSRNARTEKGAGDKPRSEQEASETPTEDTTAPAEATGAHDASDGDRESQQEAPRKSRSRRGGRGKKAPANDDGNRNGNGSNKEPVVGMGDHVPAFMLRPIPSRKRA